jgi:hypothetical protein
VGVRGGPAVVPRTSRAAGARTDRGTASATAPGGRGPLLGPVGRALAPLFPADLPQGMRTRRRSIEIVILNVAAVGAGAGLLLVRQAGPDPSWNTLYGEDGAVFLPRALSHPLSGLTQPLNAYLQFVPQLIADAVTRLPLQYAAAGMAVGGALVASACAVLVGHASAGHVRSRGLRCLLALSVVLLPIAPIELAANAVDLPWYLIFASFWVLVWRPRSPAGYAAAALVCFGAMSSQFVAILLAPLVLARLIALPRLSEHAPSLGWLAGLAMQVPVLLRKQPAQLRGSPVPALGFYADHVLTGVVAGWHLARGLAVEVGSAGAATIAGCIVAAVAAWALIRGDGRVRRFVVVAMALGLAVAVIPAMSRVWVAHLPSSASWLPGARYTAVPILLIVSAGIVAVDACLRRTGMRREAAAHAMAVVLLVVVLGAGWVADFRYHTTRSDSRPWSAAVSSFDQSCRKLPPSAYRPMPILRTNLPCSLAEP